MADGELAMFFHEIANEGALLLHRREFRRRCRSGGEGVSVGGSSAAAACSPETVVAAAAPFSTGTASSSACSLAACACQACARAVKLLTR